MTAEEAHRLKRPVSGEDWSRGPADAVTLVEYLDFQCPVCQAAYPVIENVLESLAFRVRFVVRHFPVASIHPQAERAALAAEAAGRQERFWEMHRRLFEAKGHLEEDDLLRYAEEIGLDLDRFKRDMADEPLRAKIREQKMLGIRSGVNGTPTLYINGLRYDGLVNETDLSGAILAEPTEGRG
jgi:protein-disulfide isomerase